MKEIRPDLTVEEIRNQHVNNSVPAANPEAVTAV